MCLFHTNFKFHDFLKTIDKQAVAEAAHSKFQGHLQVLQSFSTSGDLGLSLIQDMDNIQRLRIYWLSEHVLTESNI